MEDKDIKAFGSSKNKNFSVKDSIGVPHTYCITSKHLKYNEGMVLDVEATEEKGAVCDICRVKNNKDGTPILSYKEHEQALLIDCKKEAKGVYKVELRKYLNKIKDRCEKKGFVGFSFLKNF